jgi:hypothetical protein
MSGNHPVQQDIPWSHLLVDRLRLWWVVPVGVHYFINHLLLLHHTMQNNILTLRQMFLILMCRLRRTMHGEVLLVVVEETIMEEGTGE